MYQCRVWVIKLMIVQGAGRWPKYLVETLDSEYLQLPILFSSVCCQLSIVMADDVKEFVDAKLNQISLEKLDPEIQKLKELLDSRNKDAIIKHLSLHSGPQNFEVCIIQS